MCVCVLGVTSEVEPWIERHLVDFVFNSRIAAWEQVVCKSRRRTAAYRGFQEEKPVCCTFLRCLYLWGWLFDTLFSVQLSVFCLFAFNECPLFV